MTLGGEDAESWRMVVNRLRCYRETRLVEVPCSDDLCVEVPRLFSFVSWKLASGTLVHIAFGERQVAGKGDEPVNEAHEIYPSS